MVGLLSGFTFGEGHAHMAPGDVLLIFTDGLVEAENLRGEDLGEETLAQIVRNRPEASADDLFEALLVETFRHMEGKGFRDDVTLVVVKRLPS